MAKTEPRKEPFGRYYGLWVKDLPSLGRNALRVMLTLWEVLDFDSHGNASAFYSRAKMADELNLTEAQITEAVRQLKNKGLLSVKYPGHNGSATVYNVFPGKPWPAKPRFKRNRGEPAP